MPGPFENSVSAAKESCSHLNDILKNCAKSGEQPTQETVNGITAALDALRNAEGKCVDRIGKEVSSASSIYS